MRPSARPPVAVAAGLAACATACLGAGLAPARASAQPARPAASAPAAAPQAPSKANGVILGTIYDSLGARPLRGADVRLDGTEHTATTDAAGAFRIAGVPAGEYVLAFDHAEFDSLGVGLPYGRVRVTAGDTVAVLLTTPSVGTIARGLCSGLDVDTAGVLLGAVRRAGAGAPLAGARVTARWTEWVPAGAELRKTERTLEATADASGIYRLCGAPNDVAVQLTATPAAGAGIPDLRTGSVVVDLHGRTVTLREVAVRVFAADSVAGAPSRADAATLVLRVVDASERPVAGAQLRAAGREVPLGVSDEQGQLRAINLPAGSQSFQLLALGYQPRTVSADLRAGRTAESVVRVGPRVATQLSEVRVVARGTGWDRSGFEERRRSGQGHYLTADEVRARQPTYFSQLAVGQLGFDVIPGRNGSAGYQILSRRSGSINLDCPVQYFVDGAPLQVASGTSVDDVVNPSDIRGVEFYPGIGTVPARFNLGSRNACGTIAIWTGANRAPSPSSTGASNK